MALAVWDITTALRGIDKMRLSHQENRLQLIHIRDLLSYGLRRKATCFGDRIVFEDQPSEAFYQKEHSLYDFLQLTNAGVHHMSLEEAYSWIGEKVEDIVAIFLKDAETDKARAVINAYTEDDVKTYFTLVSPEEFQDMSGTFSRAFKVRGPKILTPIPIAANKKICTDYMNLRFSSCVYDKMLLVPCPLFFDEVAEFSRKYPELYSPPDIGIFQLRNKLRQAIDKMPEGQRHSAIKDWTSLCTSLPIIAHKDKQRRAQHKRMAAINGRELNEPQISENSQVLKESRSLKEGGAKPAVMETSHHLNPPGVPRNFSSWAAYGPSSPTQSRGSYQKGSQLLDASLRQPCQHLTRRHVAYNILGYRQPKSVHLGRRLWFSLQRIFRV